MSQVIDFSKYLNSKNCIVNKIFETRYMKESFAASELELELKRAGLKNARVFHEEDKYIVILETDLITYFRLVLAIKFFYKLPLRDVFLKILKNRNEFSEDVVIFRNWPSKRKVKKLLKEWKIDLPIS